MIDFINTLIIYYLKESLLFLFFFLNDTATTEIYTLSLHDALPICRERSGINTILHELNPLFTINVKDGRSEERFSRNAETDLVCRLLLEKKKTTHPNATYTLTIPSHRHV